MTSSSSSAGHQGEQIADAVLPRTGDHAVDAALGSLDRAAAAPAADPLAAARALAVAHEALRARLADAG